MKIRPATPADIEELTHLKKPKFERHRHVFHQNQLERLKEMEEGKVVYLVAEESGVLVAHVLLKLNGIPTEPGYPNINDLHVLEERQNKGIGTKLLAEVEAMMQKRGFSKISLAVNPTLNPNAKRLYERLGYKQTKTPPYLDGVYDGDEDWVVDMVKQL